MARVSGEAHLIRLLACLLLWLGLGAVAHAQSAIVEIGRLAAEWDATAKRTETLLNAESASSNSLESLRDELSVQRDQAGELRDQAKAVEEPLRARLEALGPGPENGVAEAEEIASLRQQLAEEISAAEVPVKAADTGFRRAESLISRIDEQLRNRFRQELLTLRPSPLSPLRISAATIGLAARLELAGTSAIDGIGQTTPGRWIALALALAGVFILAVIRRRTTRWFEGRLSRAMRAEDASIRYKGVWDGLGLTLAALIIPMIGIILLLSALHIGGAVTGAAAPLIHDLGWIAWSMIGAYWLAETVFGRDVPAQRYLPLTPETAATARRMTFVLGMVFGLDAVFIRGSVSIWLPAESLSALSFILLLAGGWAMFVLGTAIREGTPPLDVATSDADQDDEPVEIDPRIALGRAVRRIVVRVLRIVAILSPLLAAIGLYAGSRQIFYPTLLSAALLGACLVIVALISEAVESAARGKPGRLQLLPVVAGFLLAMLCSPLLALVWGARKSDLSEIWRLMVDGVSIGEARISPADFIVFAIIFGAGYMLTRLIKSLLRITVLPQTSLDTGGQRAVVSMSGYVGIILAALAAISATGLDLSNLAIVAGALSVGIGFGLQTVVSNFVSGLILLIERPIKEGDWIKVGEVEGTVRRISVRATAIQTFDRAVVTVPNADFMTSSVLNRTHRSTTGRVKINVGVAYGSDTRKVERLLREVAGSCNLLLRRPPPNVVFAGFGADSLDFTVNCYLRDVNTILDATNEINHGIYERFNQEGIEIPFAQRDLHLRNIDELARALRRRQDPDTANPAGEPG